MARNRLLIKAIGLTRQFQFAMDRLVRNAEQRSIGHAEAIALRRDGGGLHVDAHGSRQAEPQGRTRIAQFPVAVVGRHDRARAQATLERSEEHTSELQSLMRISYAV